MRNQLRRLSLCSLTVLSVLAGACAKASFAPATEGGVETGGAGGAGGTDGPATIGDSGVEPDVEPDVRESCSEPNLPCSRAPAAGICDPVCQVGGCNWCNEKCTYIFDGTSKQPACVSKTGKGVFPASCTYSSGNSTQSDDCAQGSICLPPSVGDLTPYCFRLCAGTADCPSAVACGQRALSPAGGSVGVCDPPYASCGIDGTCCDPLGLTPGLVPCPTNRVCLLVSPDPGSQHSRTMCDFDPGSNRVSQSCSSSHDCLAKLTCVNHICQQVCSTVDSTAPPCPLGTTCTGWGEEYGYCQTDH
jgi:hypothetical protein